MPQDYVYAGDVPVFYGHYWRQGEPRHLHDWTDYAACVDFSAVKGGALTAYRWSGEARIDPMRYVSVASEWGGDFEAGTEIESEQLTKSTCRRG